jgi:hypothetical protein
MTSTLARPGIPIAFAITDLLCIFVIPPVIIVAAIIAIPYLAIRHTVGFAFHAFETLGLRVIYRIMIDPGVLIECALALATIGFGIWISVHHHAPFRMFLVMRAPWWVWLIGALVLGLMQFFAAGTLRDRVRARICGVTFVAWSMFLSWLLIIGGLNLLHYTLGPLVLFCIPRIVTLFGPYEDFRSHNSTA